MKLSIQIGSQGLDGHPVAICQRKLFWFQTFFESHYVLELLAISKAYMAMWWPECSARNFLWNQAFCCVMACLLARRQGWILCVWRGGGGVAYIDGPTVRSGRTQHSLPPPPILGAHVRLVINCVWPLNPWEPVQGTMSEWVFWKD